MSPLTLARVWGCDKLKTLTDISDLLQTDADGISQDFAESH